MGMFLLSMWLREQVSTVARSIPQTKLVNSKRLVGACNDFPLNSTNQRLLRSFLGEFGSGSVV